MDGVKLLRGLTLASVALIYGTIVMGSYVSSSFSGLGCSHWPGCEPDHFFPDLGNTHAVIEWMHRSFAAAAGFAILGMFLAAVRHARHDRRLLLAATTAFLLLPVQAGLGAVVVQQDLKPALVALHMAVAAALFGAIVTTAVFAFLTKPKSAASREEAEAPSFRSGAREASERERA